MKYEKGSFIVVPNKNSLKGSGMAAQAVFLWICSYANKNGICIPARSTLARDIGITDDTVDAAIKKLCSRGLLSKIPRFMGSRQLTNAYQVLVKESDVEEEDLLADEECNCGFGTPHKVRDCKEGGPILSTGGAEKTTLGGADIIGTELNPVLTQPTNSSVAIAPRSEWVITEDENKPLRKKADTEYKEIFSFFSKKSQGWMFHRPQIDAAKRLLKMRGVKQVEAAMAFYREHEGEDKFYEIHTPYDLESKWSKIFYYKKKHGL